MVLHEAGIYDTIRYSRSMGRLVLMKENNFSRQLGIWVPHVMVIKSNAFCARKVK